MANYLLDTNHAAALVTLGHPLRLKVLLLLQVGDTFAIDWRRPVASRLSVEGAQADAQY
jgi:hypothetical protein